MIFKNKNTRLLKYNQLLQQYQDGVKFHTDMNLRKIFKNISFASLFTCSLSNATHIW